MTPANICGMAHIKGLDAIAVTDHNTARNLPYVKEAADYYGLILLPGIEVTTREEVHLLGYFRTVEAAMAAGEIFSAHLPPIPNKPSLFGRQLIMNTDDEIVGEESRMLIGIIRDITEEESSREKRENISRQTVEVADKVVEKQMRIVQEIASLLGETAAETKIALAKLKESVADE